MTPQSPLILPSETTSAEALSAVRAALQRAQLAGAEEALELARPGASNMNWVVRARLPGRSIILKQARPYVEKYPSIAAPIERSGAETRFYTVAQRTTEVAARLPRLLGHDAASHLLFLEDLGAVTPLERAYVEGFVLDAATIDDLAAWVTALHRQPVDAPEAPTLANASMRALNHAHIFDLPLQASGPFDGFLEGVTPGLAALSRELRAEAGYVAAVRALGASYLNVRQGSLLHGDLFLGSLLRRPTGEVMVIDPEFSFVGEPEFDLGVFWAHLLLSGQPANVVQQWHRQAIVAAGRSATRAAQFAGVEIMRRLIGVAQLPIERSLEEKATLLEQSRHLVLTPSAA